MRILGISAFYHDSAAALVVDGRIVAAAQEERFTRRKHDPDYPANAVRYCLQAGGLRPSDLDHVAYFEKPFVKFERLIETYLAFAPRGFASFRHAVPVWVKEKLFLKRLLARRLDELDPAIDWPARMLFSEHHLSHAASAYYPSPFERALVLTMDGVGEWATTSLALGEGSDLRVLREIHFPHSLGLLYSAFTYYCGFRVNSGEYKLMGLAPYGEPRYAELIREHLVDVKDDGSFHLDLRYFDYCTGLTMTSARFHALFGGPPRAPEARLEQRHMDLAASIQVVLEDIVLRLTRAAADEFDVPDLCLAGGVALNCVANGRILRDGRFRRVWIQPAAGDAGGALGAALAAFHLRHGRPRTAPVGDGMQGAYLGPEFTQDEIEAELQGAGARFERLDDATLLQRSVEALLAECALGWFQGRMEFGPRALGARSILGDPRSPRMQSTLNLKIKFRESFRPFAPAVLAADVAHWFELAQESPYMLLVADVRPEHRRTLSEDESGLEGIALLNTVRSSIPAVTHVDHSARIQTVHVDTNPRFHALLTEFKRRTGCGVLVNTSFNVRGEPIVGTPTDAFRCFMGTDMEALAIGNCWLHKDAQDPALAQRYEGAFGLD